MYSERVYLSLFANEVLVRANNVLVKTQVVKCGFMWRLKWYGLTFCGSVCVKCFPVAGRGDTGLLLVIATGTTVCDVRLGTASLKTIIKKNTL